MARKFSKLPSYGFYPSLCTFIYSFLSDWSIAAVVDSHCTSPKPINSCVPQGSVLSPTLFLLFINDLNLTKCHIHCYADNTTLHFSTSYNRHPTQQELSDSRWDAIGCLTSDLSLVSDWGRANLVLFNASKTQFLQQSTRHNLPDNYPLFFIDTQLPLSSTLNILGLFLTEKLNIQFRISTLAKSASKKLGVLWCLCHTVPLNRVESKAFCLINSPPLTDCLDSLSHRHNVASLSIFYHYFHAECSSELGNYMSPSLP